MKRVICIAALVLAGCATDQKSLNYWTDKNGVCCVHHVTGNTDKIEKLSEKALSKEEIEKQNLPKGKYFQVTESQEVHTPAPDPSPSGNKKNASKDKQIEALASEVKDLKKEVSNIARTRESRAPQRVSAASNPASVNVSETNANAEADPPAPAPVQVENPPRMSQ